MIPGSKILPVTYSSLVKISYSGKESATPRDGVPRKRSRNLQSVKVPLPLYLHVGS